VTRIAVVSAGAIGSSIAADLTEANLDVTIIDQWPAHVEAMRSKGLRITMPDRVLHVDVNAHHVCDLSVLKPTFDVVLMCAKSQDTTWLTHLIEPYLAVDGVLVGVQNSMNDDLLADIVGRDRTMGCAIELSADLFVPGEVIRNTSRDGTWLAIGEPDGSLTPRTEMISTVLGHASVVEATTKIASLKWSKLIANSMSMGLFGLFGMLNWDALRLPGIHQIQIALGRETVAVGEALGYDFEPIFGLTAEDFVGSVDERLSLAVETLMHHVGRESQTAIVVDYKKGRRSEYDFISGLVVRMGNKTSIETPYNAIVTDLHRHIDRGEIPMEPANFDRLIARIHDLESTVPAAQ
jgi:2-dehydropantoate 2-reductase